MEAGREFRCEQGEGERGAPCTFSKGYQPDQNQKPAKSLHGSVCQRQEVKAGDQTASEEGGQWIRVRVCRVSHRVSEMTSFAQAGRRIILKSVKTKGKLKEQTLETVKTSAAAGFRNRWPQGNTRSFRWPSGKKAHLPPWEM